MMIYIALPLFLLLVSDGVKDHLRSDGGWTECLQPEFAIGLLTDGVVDSTDNLFHAKYFFGNLTRHDVAVITISDGNKDIGFFTASTNGQGVAPRIYLK